MNISTYSKKIFRRTLAMCGYFQSGQAQKQQRGFSLMELIVVIGILTLISGLVLANYSRFGGQILLRNLAYDVALSIRESQVYGISARSFLGADFAVGHGVFFDLLAADGATLFYLFTDTNQDGLYSVAQNEWVQTYTIGKGHSIDRICVRNGVSEDCFVQQLNLLFKRPEPDAIISADTGSGFFRYESARVVFRSPKGHRVSVLVETTGQISVQPYNPVE